MTPTVVETKGNCVAYLIKCPYFCCLRYVLLIVPFYVSLLQVGDREVGDAARGGGRRCYLRLESIGDCQPFSRADRGRTDSIGDARSDHIPRHGATLTILPAVQH